MSLEGRTYIVTGAAGGMGLAITGKLVLLGAKVHALDLDPTGPRVFQNDSIKYHGPVDVASRTAVKEFYQKLQGTYIDGLVNCAGICPGEGEIAEDDIFEKIMAVNVTGVWNMTTEAIPIMLSQEQRDMGSTDKRRGNIVTIGSVASLVGTPGLAVYTASKHAVLGLTRSWAKEFGRRGIRANLVAPGLVDTPMLRKLNEKEGSLLSSGPTYDMIVKSIPAGRIGSAEDIADAVAFLLGDESKYISGQALPVNGAST